MLMRASLKLHLEMEPKQTDVINAAVKLLWQCKRSGTTWTLRVQPERELFLCQKGSCR